MKTRKSKPIGVYWINLDRSTERRENMLTVLKDPVFDGMSKHRVVAIDGRNPEFKQKVKSWINVPMTDTIQEYACLFSHLKALKQFVKSSHSLALILEDDVCLDFKSYWQTTIQKCIQNAPSDWELLQLSYIGDIPKKLYTPTKLYTGALSYVVNKNGVIRFLKQFHLDHKHVSDYVLYDQMKCYTYQYPLFISTLKDSELHTDHIQKYHVPNKRKLEAYLKGTFSAQG
jgi:GR25 family glycosyltransferase involved in LPS biosynthesis